jgi:ferricrocin synthase
MAPSVLNPERQVLPGRRLLHELIATHDNEAVAIEFLQDDNSLRRITYGAFKQLSSVLASRIQACVPHATSTPIIPVVVPQCPELYVAWHAILQAGACFCPISPDVPSERLKFILDDVSAGLIICVKETYRLVQDVAKDLSCLSVALEDLETRSGGQMSNGHHPPYHAISPESPAYVMYTSGSTGQPKGVLVSHHSATQSLLAHHEHIPTFKRFLQFASPTFDVSVFEIFFPLFRGATLVSRVREFMLADLGGTIVRLNADAAELTPTVAGSLLRTRAAAPCLQLLLTIGEMLTRAVIDEFGGNASKPSMLYAMYGPTEAAIHCTVAPNLPASASVQSIGRPLSTVTAVVIAETEPDKPFQVVPVGVTGELAIAGQLANGYLNRPDQNEASFIVTNDHGRLYRTGDRAKCLSDGTLEILGRISSGQVKLRGQRVELGEIEEIAAQIPGVLQTAACVAGDTLLLFCTGNDKVSVEDIEATCKSWLPPFMRPSRVILSGDNLPRLPSGKLDRKQLELSSPALDNTKHDDALRFHTETEKIVAEAVYQHIDAAISRTDDLWSYGMDSLKAIKICSTLRKRLPNVPMKAVLTGATIVDISRRLDDSASSEIDSIFPAAMEDDGRWRAVRAAAVKYLTPAEQNKVADVVPCTPIQTAMLAETTAKADHNFNSIKLSVPDGVTPHVIWKALRKLALHSPILRSGFVPGDDPSIPFVRVIWKELEAHTASLSHPLQVAENGSPGEEVTITIHHAIYDGWSWDLIVHDLNKLLAHQPLPPRTTFESVSHFILLNLSAAKSDHALAYWSNILKDLDSARFPCLCADVARKRPRTSLQMELDAPLTLLTDVAARMHISRQSFVQACWALVLSTYTDSSDVLFGTVVSGRHAAIDGIEDVIGPCLATLPTRLRLGRVRSVRDLLHYIQRQNLDSLQFYDTPLRDIMRSSNKPDRDTLFDTLVVWQEGPFIQVTDGIATLDTFDALNYTAVIECEPRYESCYAKISFDANLIPTEHAQLILGQVNTLLNLILKEPDEDLTIWYRMPKSMLSISDRVDSNHILDWSLHAAIRNHSVNTPDHVAIDFVEDFDPISGAVRRATLTYEELYHRASIKRGYLHAAGYGSPDAIICVALPKSVDLYVTILAIVMTGAAYVCIDPHTPRSRLEQVVQESKCKLLITYESHRYRDCACAILTDLSSAKRLNGAVGQSAKKASPDHLAYSVFTSGTTGVPKGVLITRGNLASHIDHLSRAYPHDSLTDALLQACSPAFDVSVFEIFWTWHMGMRLVSASNDILFRDLETFINTTEVTHLSMTPSVAALIRPERVPSIKMLVTAGEPMNSKVFGEWADRGLWQGYGPSETTNICNVRPLVCSTDAKNNVGPVFDNTSAFVCARLSSGHVAPSHKLSLDHFRPVPIGGVGEIWIGGDQVGGGYTDKDLTERSFLEHPEHGWLYRSGDIGRLLADKSLVIMGREDDQIKLRGQRIELGDVASCILKLESITDAVCLVELIDNVQRLLAFVAPEQWDESCSRAVVELVSEHAEANLPRYMIPDVIMPIKMIPLTAQGKADQRRLLVDFYNLSEDHGRLVWRDGQDDQASHELLSGTERQVAEALGDVLGIDWKCIRNTTSFYTLGLDSLSAVRFSQILRRSGLPQIDVSTIMKHSTVRTLASRVQLNGFDDGPVETGLREHANNIDMDNIRTSLRATGYKIETILPCTDIQLSMLSASADGKTKTYWNRMTFQLNCDVSKLKSAWDIVSRRQPLLRTIMVPNDSAAMPYVQVVLEYMKLPWSDAKGGLPNVTFNDTDHEPWWRLRVVSNELQLNMHHALYDAAAMGVLLREVEAAYMNQELPSVIAFESYLDYAVNMDEEVVDQFWKRKLQRPSPTRLQDLLKTQARSSNSGITSARLDSTIPRGELEKHAKSQAATTLSCLQAVLARLLLAYTGMTTTCIGNVYSGRNLPLDGTHRIIGPCFNTLPVSIRVNDTSSTEDIVKSLQNFNVEVIPFQSSSPRRIQKMNSPDGKPLFDVLLLLQQDATELDAGIWTLKEEYGDMVFPFILEVSPGDKEQPLELSLHSSVAKESILRQILHDFDHVLEDSMRYPEATALNVPVDVPGFLLPQEAGYYDSQENSQDAQDLSQTERAVVETLSQISHQTFRRVFPSTTVFRLGLDSISAVRLAAKLRDRGFQITSVDILQGPTIREIASKCEMHTERDLPPHPSSFDFATFDLKHRAAILRRCDARDEDVAAVRPCTPLQAGILSHFLQSDRVLYWNTVTMQLPADVDWEALRAAWATVMNQHEILRTGFEECEDDAYSFAMITYHPGARGLPWSDDKSHKSLFDHKGNRRSISDPPWTLFAMSETKRLQLSILHSLYDAVSFDRIFKDVAHAYSHRDLTTTIGLADALSTILTMSNSDESQAFWTAENRIMHATKMPDLNIGAIPDPVQLISTRTLTTTLSDINQACAGNDCTLQAACQANFAKILSAYTGQDSVTFGLVVSGRNFDDSRDDVVFPCINTLPCTSKPGMGGEELLKEIATFNAAVTRHNQVPLTSIKRWQGFEGTPFDTILVLQAVQSPCQQGVPWKVVEETAHAEYALSMEVVPDPENDSLMLRATYSTKIMAEAAASILLSQFETELAKILHSDQMSAVVKQKIYSLLNPVQDLLPHPITFLHDLVATAAIKNPAAIALEYVESFDDARPVTKTWTYAQLNDAGNRVANLLLSLGAKSGDLIATCFEKCAMASFAILGVLKAGCAYVAIDPSAPADRREFILKDAACSIVLTMSNLEPAFAASSAHIVPLDTELISAMSDANPRLTRVLRAEDTCYCLYTSGTTGTPKGCLISHNSAVQAMMSFQSIFEGRWTPDSRWLQFASFHFDVSVLEQYWSWSVGIRVTTAPRDLMLEDLPAFLRQTSITHLDLTPSLARLISPEEVPSLCEGVFIVGGEQVSQDIIDTWGDAGCLYNFYGPSEVTIGCTVHPRVKKGTKPTNIGQLWDNVGCRVLKPGTAELVLRGAAGELCLTGVLVGKGYLNRPQLTQEKFSVLSDGTRVYRTGDLVRLLHDNSFEFLGRIDDQVKLRGQRLEIGEINHMIKAASAAITAVSTLVLKHPSKGKEQLVAFFSTEKMARSKSDPQVVSGDEADDLIAQVRGYCSEKLPGYMLPTSFLMVSAMPLSANNKVDSKVLKALYQGSHAGAVSTGEPDAGEIRPENRQTFEMIREAICEKFHLTDDLVQPKSRLFELGLDSISAVGLARKLRMKGFGNASIQNVLGSRIVMDLVHMLKLMRDVAADDTASVTQAQNAIDDFGQRHLSDVARALRVPERRIETVSPCTAIQEGMLNKAYIVDKEGTTYFARFDFQLLEDTDLEKLRHAWQVVVDSTSILRTRFVATIDGFAQAVLQEDKETSEPKLEAVPMENDHAFVRWIKQVKTALGSRPWKLRLHHKGSRPLMTLYIFHALYDGIALDLLMNRVASAYMSGTTEPSNFHNLLTHGPLREVLEAETFWKSSLRNIRQLKFSSQLTETSTDSDHFSYSQSLTLPRMGSRCSDLGVSNSALCHAIWLLCLEQTFRANPTIGLVVSGRSISHQDAERVIGPMFNTIPCAIQVDGSTTDAMDLVRSCHEFSIASLPYQHTPLRQIAKWLKVDPSQGLFNSLFVFQKEPVRSDGDQLWHQLPSTSTPDYSLNLEVEQRADGSFGITIVTKPSDISPSQGQDLIKQYALLLERFNRGDKIPLPNTFLPSTSDSRVANDPEVGIVSNEAPTQALTWTNTSLTIRAEVAKLAAVAPETVSLHEPSLLGLGLDSIDVMKLATRLKRTGICVPISAIMRNPTLAGIALVAQRMDEPDYGIDGSSLLDAGQQSPLRHLVEQEGIKLHTDDLVFPVTAMQEGLLLEYDRYYNVLAFELLATTDIDRYIQAWQDLAQTTQILRTQFVAIQASKEAAGISFLQVVSKHPRLEVEDFSGRDVGLATEGLKAMASRRTFAMPAVKLALMRGWEQTTFLVGMPHAGYDGWSLKLMLGEVTARYHARESHDAQNALACYSSHMKSAMSSSKDQAQKAFWHKVAAKCASAVLARHATGNGLDAQLSRQHTRLSFTKVQSFCNEQRISMQSLGLAAWTIVLARRCQQSNVSFGMVLSGRTTQGSDELLFPTFNTVLFATSLKESLTHAELLQQIHASALDVSDHQHYPLKEVLKQVRARLGQAEVFDTLFTYQKAPQVNVAPELEIHREIELDTSSINPPYPINVELEATTEGLVWTLACQAGIFSAAETDAVLSELDDAMTELVQSPEKRTLQTEEWQKLAHSSVGAEARQYDRRLKPEDTFERSEQFDDRERVVRDALATVSGTEPQAIRPDTSLFNVGLDSISAIKLAAELKKRGLKLPISRIIALQTVRRMAAAAIPLDTAKGDAASESHRTVQASRALVYTKVLEDHGIPSTAVDAVLPATAGQLYMLDLWRASQGRLMYPTFWLDVTNSTESNVHKAMSRLAEATPMLRTSFLEVREGAVKHIFQVQLTAAAAKQHKKSIPWAYDIGRRPDGSLLVILRIHHALYDAVSFDLLVQQLETLCSNKSPLKQPSDFGTFIDRVCSLESTAKQRQQHFWTSYLAGAASSPPPTSTDFAGRRIERFEPHLHSTSKLQPKLRAAGITIQALLLATFARVYGSRHPHPSRPQTTVPSVVLGIYLSKRSLDIASLPTLAAPTLNIVPIRISTDAKLDLITTARQVQTDLVKISEIEHCGVSLEEIWRWTGVRLGCTVNILALPERNAEENSGDRGGETGGVVRITHASREIVNALSTEEDVGESKAPPAPFLENMYNADPAMDGGGRPWVLPGVDIEAKITDGMLAMGVFGTEDVIGGEQRAEGWLKDARKLLEEAV